ncbi:hypothetical protein JEY40_37045 [Bradyrhizobium japonicum]|uniref:hypothetical protein n=1 Tax=Bradyrhizobium japonicum TaxID=375 RepID=UPI00048576D7|nr:hypothetical protein [Bradyrhizobium japonicum]UQD71402.1 hypothetical protein JEY40_37045 [Bradyrhizobium japonicum]
MFAEATQNRFGVLALSIDGRAEPGAGSTEEVTGTVGVAAAETIEFAGERGDIQSVAILPRYGEAQQRQLPGAEQPVRPFD